MLRTGLVAWGATIFALRHLRTVRLLDPRAQKGPPRIELVSTPITPAGYGVGVTGPSGAGGGCGTRANEGPARHQKGPTAQRVWSSRAI